jgi:hypothetical protein
MQMPFRRTMKKLFLYVVVMVVFICLTLVVAYAGTVYYIGTDQDGNTYWVSCGSSAGNSSWTCPPNGGACTDTTDHNSGAEAFCLNPPPDN